jgi:hypothetical protein
VPRADTGHLNLTYYSGPEPAADYHATNRKRSIPRIYCPSICNHPELLLDSCLVLANSFKVRG